MPRRHIRRAGLVLGGFAVGLLVVAILVYGYFRAVTDARLAEGVLRRIELPAGVLEIEAIEGDSVARVAAREVELLDADGRTVAAAPLVRAVVDLASLRGEGPIEISQLLLTRPTVDFVQYPNGETSFSDVVRVTAGGEEVRAGGEEGRGVVIRDVRIADGSVRWSSPYRPDSLPLSAQARAAIRTTRIGGALMRVRTVEDLDLWAPRASFGGDAGWSVELAAASAQLADPAIRVLNVAGSAAQEGEGGIRFALESFRTESSSLAGEGTIRLGGETPQFDVALRAAPLDFGDLAWFAPALPAEGRAEGTFTLVSRAGGRTAVTARELVVTAFDSRVAGRFSALVGGNEPAAFWDTRLDLDPLRIETLEQLGLVEELAYTGEVRGTVSSDAAEPGSSFELDLDLAATFAPAEGATPPSTVFLRGPVTVGGEEAPVRFAGVEVVANPLHLAALVPLAPEQRERLRGTVAGSATVSGTVDDLRVTGGDLSYEVDGAPRTRLTGLTLALTREPELRFTLDARAEPLALATISALFPAFPFRTAGFAGPIHIEGTADHFRIDTELTGAAGLIAVTGTVSPGAVLRMDLTGRVASFNAQAVLDGTSNLGGPVSGTFAVNGSVDDLRFDVNMVQGTEMTPAPGRGRFNLSGTFRRVGGEPIVDVAGDVANFNLGALIGRPALLPDRMTGSLRVAGGGREPYRFDVDLRGSSGRLDVEGWYATGTIPSYQVTGTVAGLNLRQLPRGETLPATDLNADIDVRGQGTTLETLAGDFHLNATRSTVAGRPLEALRADVTVREGVASFDTLVVALEGTRLNAEGTWGLTRPVATPLNFRLATADASRLAPFLPTNQGVPPQVTGAFTMEGSVAGSVRVPVVDVRFEGENLRYEAWRARTLEFGLAATIGDSIPDIVGELTLNGEALALAGKVELASLSLGLEGGGGRVAVRAAANRDARTAVALTGLLEMTGSVPSGVMLDSLTVRAGESLSWALVTPAQLRWGPADGLFVSNLNLQRTDGEQGTIAVNGAIPPNGVADLRVAIDNMDLALIRELMPTVPPIAGVVHLDATLSGPANDPDLVLDGWVSDLLYRDVAADSLALRGRYADRVFNANAAVSTAGTDLATAEAAIPMVLTLGERGVPSFELLRNEPLRAVVRADSLPAALLASAIPLVYEPTGVVSAELTAGGSMEQPALRGWAEIRDGAATFGDLGVRYDGMAGRLTFDGEQVRIDSLVVHGGDGTASATGTIRLVDLETPELYIQVSMDGFHAIANEEIADLIVSGSVGLAGRMPRPVLTGNVSVDEGTLFFPDFGQEAPLELTEIELGEIAADTALIEAVGPGFVQNVQIQELNVALEEGVWMEAPTARVEIRGALIVYRTGRIMRLYGDLEASRGTYQLTIGPIARDFDVTGGSVRFLGTPDLNPQLDITAEHDVRTAGAGGGPATLTIVVRVTGTAEYPRVALTSDTSTPLPESELLNYLVFGQPSFRLGQQQNFGQQLLVQEVFGGLLVQQLAAAGLPCQYFRLRARPELSTLAGIGATTFECGMQLLPDVFLTLETGVADVFSGSELINALGLSLDWQVKDYLSARIAREPVRTGIGILSASGDVRYQWSADVNGNWEFARPDTTVPPPGAAPVTPLPGVVAPAVTVAPTTPAAPAAPATPAETPRASPPAGQGAAPTRESEIGAAP